MNSQLLDCGSLRTNLATACLSPRIAQTTGSATELGRRLVHPGRRRAVATGTRTAALRAAWTSHTLKRAMAAVRSASDADYAAFGWDRGDLLARLRWLHGEVDRHGADRRAALAVTVAARDRGPSVAATPTNEAPSARQTCSRRTT